MTNKEAKEKLYMEWQKFLEDNIDYAGISEAYKMAFKALDQEPCKDAISRQAVLDLLEDTNNGWIINEVLQLPIVTPQEPSITWVTGADGAKIAFWDVPVWKVTKICEILGEPQERSEE